MKILEYIGKSSVIASVKKIIPYTPSRRVGSM